MLVSLAQIWKEVFAVFRNLFTGISSELPEFPWSRTTPCCSQLALWTFSNNNKKMLLCSAQKIPVAKQLLKPAQDLSCNFDFWGRLLLRRGPWKSKVISSAWAGSSVVGTGSRKSQEALVIKQATNLGVSGNCSAELTCLISTKMRKMTIFLSRCRFWEKYLIWEVLCVSGLVKKQVFKFLVDRKLWNILGFGSILI